MKSLYVVMFLALCTYSTATHHHLETIKKDHHHAPHFETVFKEFTSVHKPLPPPLPKHSSPVHHVLHKPIPPPLPPVFPIHPVKPIPKYHHKVPKLVTPPIVKPVLVPVPIPVHHHKLPKSVSLPILKPVAVPLPVPVPAIGHHVPFGSIEKAPKPIVPFGKDLHKIHIQEEHIDERYKH